MPELNLYWPEKKMQMIKVIIVDDEINAIEIITALCQEHSDRLEVVSTASKYLDAVEAIEKYNPDLVLLDIEMPTGSGFDVLKYFERGGILPFYVAFITAFDHYAMQAIKHNALDYILKPVDRSEFDKMIGRVVKRFGTQHGSGTTSLKNFIKDVSKERLGLPTAVGTRYVPTSSIIRVEADGSYAKVVTEEKETIVVCRMLKDFEQNLKKNEFLRVHRAHIVNMTHVVSFNKDEGNYLEMTNGDRIPVSRRDKDRVGDTINSWATTL